MSGPSLSEVIASVVDDEHVSTYLEGVLEEGGISSAEEIFASVGELLIAYDIAEDEDSAMELCTQMFDKLNVSTDNSKQENAAEQGEEGESKECVLEEGTKCQAKYTDGMWYAAEVIEPRSDSTYLVLFTEYGNEEIVSSDSIRALAPVSTTTLLNAPIVIEDNLKIEKKKKTKGGLPTPGYELNAKKVEKDRVKQEKADRAKERKLEKRKQEAKKKKEEALQAWLNSFEFKGIKQNDVRIPNFSMSTLDGSRELVSHSEFQLVSGRKYGLIGRNGVGKSTLLHAISNYELEGFPTYLRVVHVEQEIQGSDKTVLEWVVESDLERLLLLQKHADIISKAEVLDPESDEGKENLDQLKLIENRMQAIDVYGAKSRASKILAGLMFSSDMMNAPSSSLSGGWRMRVSLASALFLCPDVLLLDEPTNHLDFPAVLWLEEYLQSYPKTLILVSHDRSFVNNVITDVVHFHEKQLTYYRANYDGFEQIRADDRARQHREYEAQKMKRDHMQKFIDKFRYNAKRATLVQSRIKALNRLPVLEDIKDDAVFKFSFPEPLDLGKPIVTCTDIAFSYGPEYPTLFQGVDLFVDQESRVGVVGANGAGKSTLIKIITGALEPVSGDVSRNSNARIAVFTQHHMDSLDLNSNSIDFLMARFPGAKEPDVRGKLGRFGISEGLAMQEIRTLSGGQKSRVAFCVVTWDVPHLLIMDEPTNHLDLETIDALIDAVNSYKGGVLSVSHDQHFLSHTCKSFWGIANRKLARFDDMNGAKKFCYSKV